jgi:hypothetical protein
MPHENSVFHGILKHVPWDAFETLVRAHGADAGVRRLTTKGQFVALLYGQLSGASSLREIETGLKSHDARLYHVGGRAPRRSTLADANAHRPSAVFSEMFGVMLKQVGRGLRRKLADVTYLIDSTGLRLDSRSGWAHFSAKACGAKMHVVYDPDADRPIYAAVTTAKVNDITAAHEIPVEAGATYVFDLGYYDYRWWASLDAKGCRIVTRFKKNTPFKEIERLALPAGSTILSDRIGYLPKRQANSRHNPMADAVREVQVMTDTGKTLRIFSNDLDASAQEIADLYKRRWAIELFFRWVKQTLKVTRFIGTSENAVRIQIAVALIAFLLLRLSQQTQDQIKSALAFARIVRTNLMHCKPIQALLRSPKPPSVDLRQFCLAGI